MIIINDAYLMHHEASPTHSQTARRQGAVKAVLHGCLRPSPMANQRLSSPLAGPKLQSALARSLRHPHWPDWTLPCNGPTNRTPHLEWALTPKPSIALSLAMAAVIPLHQPMHPSSPNVGRLPMGP